MPGQDEEYPREPLASVTGTLEKEENTECCVGFDLGAFVAKVCGLICWPLTGLGFLSHSLCCACSAAFGGQYCRF